jgi:hypothetical protein
MSGMLRVEKDDFAQGDFAQGDLLLGQGLEIDYRPLATSTGSFSWWMIRVRVGLST